MNCGCEVVKEGRTLRETVVRPCSFHHAVTYLMANEKLGKIREEKPFANHT